MIGDIMQPTHLLLVLVVALLVLGPKRLPEVGRQLGSGIRDFRAAINGEHPERQEELRDAEASASHASVQSQPSESPVQHQFAHEAAAPVAEEHTFVSDSRVADDGGHTFAHAPDESVGPDAGTSNTSGDHEFGVEPAPGAETRPDPLS